MFFPGLKKVDGSFFLIVCHTMKSVFGVGEKGVLLSSSGAFLPLREMRKCVPKFSAVNIVFLYLTVYNTEEKENSYRIACQENSSTKRER